MELMLAGIALVGIGYKIYRDLQEKVSESKGRWESKYLETQKNVEFHNERIKKHLELSINHYNFKSLIDMHHECVCVANQAYKLLSDAKYSITIIDDSIQTAKNHRSILNKEISSSRDPFEKKSESDNLKLLIDKLYDDKKILIAQKETLLLKVKELNAKTHDLKINIKNSTGQLGYDWYQRLEGRTRQKNNIANTEMLIDTMPSLNKSIQQFVKSTLASTVSVSSEHNRHKSEPSSLFNMMGTIFGKSEDYSNELIVGNHFSDNLENNLSAMIVPGLTFGDIENNQGSMEISGNVTGDIENNQGSIEISGNVTGDIENNQGSIEISGIVSGDIRNNQGSIEISGYYSGEIESNQGSIDISGHVSGDIDCSHSSVEVTGVVTGNITISNCDMEVSGVINGDVYNIGSEINCSGSIFGKIIDQ